MDKWLRMLSSAYRCQKVLCVTLRIAIPFSLVLAILLGVLITMDPGYGSSPTEYRQQLRRFKSHDLAPDLPTNTSGTQSPTSDHKLDKTGTEPDDMLLKGLPLLMPFGHHVLNTNLSELRIYIYPLPKGFNKNLADCAVRNARSGECFDLSNRGRGELLKTDFLHGYSSYNTHQFSMEILFHQKLLQSKFVTWDPWEADLFYVPYYVCMRCFCPAQSGEAMNKEFWHLLLHNFTYLSQGKPHFMALGKVEQEMSSKHCPFLQSPNSHLLKYLLIEQTASPGIRSFFHRVGREDEVQVVPYPSFIHFDRPLAVIGDRHTEMVNLYNDSHAIQDESSTKNRSIFISLVGSSKNVPLRKILVEQLRNSKRGYAYVISPSQCGLVQSRVPRRILELMQDSVFCLQPPGDSPTRKSFFDSLLSGCIPVTFHDNDVVYPFMDVFNYSTFSLNIPEREITNNKHNIFSILDAIPKPRIVSMQETIAKVAVFFQYGTYRSGHGAFTTILKRLVHKFAIRKFVNQDVSHNVLAKIPKR